MTDNPYTAPLADIGYATAPTVPEEIRKKIRYAWIAACISGSLTLAFALTDTFGYTELETIDAALVFGLAFGIYKKSRVCAVLMLTYFVASKIYMMIEAGRPSGLAIALVFGFFYYHGAVGTFEYRKIVRAHADDSHGRV